MGRIRWRPAGAVISVALLTLGAVAVSQAATGAPVVKCKGKTATIVGTPGDDLDLGGTRHADVIVGLGGDDIIDGLGGPDTICGDGGDGGGDSDDGDDILFAGGKADHTRNVLVGEGGADTIGGGSGDDVIETSGPNADASDAAGVENHVGAGKGDDTVKGGAGDDTEKGGPGRDLLSGEGGADHLFGEAGDDNGARAGLLGGTGLDHLDGGGGEDALFGQDDQDFLFGGDQADHQLIGGPGDDHIFGEDGKDRLFGQADDDSLNGGDQKDHCDGGGQDGDTFKLCEKEIGAPPPPDTVSIELSFGGPGGCAPTPQTARVHVGGHAKFHNQSASSFHVSASGHFDSGTLSPGETFTTSLPNTPGRIDYDCEPLASPPTQAGTIVLVRG